MKFSEYLTESVSDSTVVDPKNLTASEIVKIFEMSGYLDVEIWAAKWDSFNESGEHVYNVLSEGGDDAPHIITKVFIGLGKNGWSADFSGVPDQEFELADDAEAAFEKVGSVQESSEDADEDEEFPEI